MMNNPEFKKIDFSSLMLVLGGGMAIQRPVAERWLEMTGRPITEGYGLSETSPVATVNRLDVREFTGMIGLPLPFDRYRDPRRGRQHAADRRSGRNLHPWPAGHGWLLAAPRRDGEGDERRWLLPLRRHGPDGRTRVCEDRRPQEGHDPVSGFNVYPNEIEEVAVMHAGVLECAAVGCRTNIPARR